MIDYSKHTVHGLIGDQNAAEHGGGIVFTSEHGPHLEYTYGAETDAPDFDQHADDADLEACKLEVFQVRLHDSAAEFLSWYDWIDWDAVKRSIGMSDDDENTIGFATVMERAGAVEAAAGYYGWREFDDQPCERSYADVDCWYAVWRVQHNMRLAAK